MDRNYPGTGFGDLGAGAGWSYERSAKARYASDPDNVHASVVLLQDNACDLCKQRTRTKKDCRHRVHLLSCAFLNTAAAVTSPHYVLCIVICTVCVVIILNRAKKGGEWGNGAVCVLWGWAGWRKRKRLGGHELCD